MSEPRTLEGHPPASFLGQAGWIFYDLAQGPYFVTIVIAVFSPFFAESLVGNVTKGQEIWAYVMGTAGVLVALMSPFMGALVDAVGPRKPGLFITMLIGVTALGGLWFAVPGAPGAVALASGLIIVCAVSLEIAGNFHNSFLPSIVARENLGRMSGLGYGVTYFAAVATILLWKVLFSEAETPWLGLSRETFEVERIIGPLCALWTVVFAMPLLLLTPDRPRTGLRLGAAMFRGLHDLVATFRALRHYRNIAYFLLARTIYYDGVVVTSSFMGIFTKGAFGWSLDTVATYMAAAIVTTGLGAILGGFIDDTIGAKRTILLMVSLFFLSLLAILGTDQHTIYYMPLSETQAQSMLAGIGPMLATLGYARLPEQVFVLTGLLGALTGGSVLAASRSLMARISPPDQAAQFFGLYTLTGKATAFSLPFIVGLVTRWTGSQALGLTPALVYLMVGGLGLLAVRERQPEPMGARA